MNQTHPRCALCGENPRIMHERHEGLPTYAPLCEECYLESVKSPGAQRVGYVPKRPISLPELVVTKTRFIALGLAFTCIVQAPMMYLVGASGSALVQSILLLVFGPMAAAGFWLSRRKR